MDRGTWWATVHGGRKESDMTERQTPFTFIYILEASLVTQTVKYLLAMQETQVQSLGWEDPLEKEMVIHSSTLAWRIPMDKEA